MENTLDILLNEKIFGIEDRLIEALERIEDLERTVHEQSKAIEEAAEAGEPTRAPPSPQLPTPSFPVCEAQREFELLPTVCALATGVGCAALCARTASINPARPDLLPAQLSNQPPVACALRRGRRDARDREAGEHWPAPPPGTQNQRTSLGVVA